MRLLTTTLFALMTFVSTAQNPSNADLLREMTRLDSLIFEVGFNQCDFTPHDTLIAEDLEFYHDVGGVSTSKSAFLDAMAKNICGNPDFKPIRIPITESFEVFPLYDQGVLYGVIHNGDHEFWIKEPGKELWQTGVARFTHLWMVSNGSYQLTRVLSFDHREP